MPRSVSLYYEDGFEEAVCHRELLLKERWRTLGYLAEWGKESSRYLQVKIYCLSSGDISAIYMDMVGTVTYHINAILGDTGIYTTHS